MKRPLHASTFAAAATLILASGLSHAQERRDTSANTSNRVNTRTNPPVNRRSDFSREVEFRNAIATGNAPGGLSFRGDLGYAAPSAFRGDLGSDALFAYRRDSLYSGLAGMGIRGTEALQYQFSLTTGSSPTRDLFGSPTVTRLGEGGTTDAASPLRMDTSFDNSTRVSTRLGTSAPISTRAQTGVVDRSVTGTLRSTSSHRSSSSLSPEIVSVFETGIERDQYGVVASPLLGLVSTPMSTARSTRSQTVGARNASRVPTSYAETVERVRERAEALFERQKLIAEGGVPNAPQRPERAEAPTPEARVPDATQRPETADQWVQERFVELYEQIQGTREDADATLPIPGPGGADEQEQRVNPIERDPTDPGLMFVDESDLIEGRTIKVNPLTLELIQANDNMVSYLIDPDAENRDVYTEHVRAGERLMSQGRYFDAEERFTRALGVRRGDVSAQIGRLHAQIGAGLVISASINLQTIMVEHPELIAQRYTAPVIPTGKRAEEIILTLRERSGIDAERVEVIPEPTSVRLSASFVLAYMGYQTGRPELIDASLAVVSEIGGDAEARLASMYRQIWTLDEPAPSTAGDDGAP